MGTSGISSSFLELSRLSGYVIHVLLTRSLLCPRASPGSSLNLHVLGTPPAFVLSQDQTLREKLTEGYQSDSRGLAGAGSSVKRKGVTSDVRRYTNVDGRHDGFGC